MSAAFQLRIDGDHLGDDETDASLVKFEGWGDVSFIATTEQKLPAQILFEANVTTLATIAYPINNVAWPIMSKRMLDTLRSVGDFAHRAIPVVMLDDTVTTKDRLDPDGKPRPGVANLEFSVVQLTKYTDAFDRERSEYVPDELFPDAVLAVKKLVLKDVPLPPLFRLQGFEGPLMVSAAAREALDKAGIRGVRFIALEHVI
jgi:hypothetical protein